MSTFSGKLRIQGKKDAKPPGRGDDGDGALEAKAAGKGHAAPQADLALEPLVQGERRGVPGASRQPGRGGELIYSSATKIVKNMRIVSVTFGN